MSDRKELVVDIHKPSLDRKRLRLMLMVREYLFEELGYIPTDVSATLRVKYKPKELKGAQG